MGIRLQSPRTQTTLSSPELGPGSSRRVTVHCRGRLAISGDTFRCPTTGGGILASSRGRPGKPLVIPQCTGRPHREDTRGRNVSGDLGLGVSCRSEGCGATVFFNILFLKVFFKMGNNVLTGFLGKHVFIPRAYIAPCRWPGAGLVSECASGAGLGRPSLSAHLLQSVCVALWGSLGGFLRVGVLELGSELI